MTQRRPSWLCLLSHYRLSEKLTAEWRHDAPKTSRPAGMYKSTEYRLEVFVLYWSILFSCNFILKDSFLIILLYIIKYFNAELLHVTKYFYSTFTSVKDSNTSSTTCLSMCVEMCERRTNTCGGARGQRSSAEGNMCVSV